MYVWVWLPVRGTPWRNETWTGPLCMFEIATQMGVGGWMKRETKQGVALQHSKGRTCVCGGGGGGRRLVFQMSFHPRQLEARKGMDGPSLVWLCGLSRLKDLD